MDHSNSYNVIECEKGIDFYMKELNINSENAAAIADNYKAFLDTLDNVIQGNVQCGHCSKWFSEEKITKGELEVCIPHGMKVIETDVQIWIDMHARYDSWCCGYDCSHSKHDRCTEIYDWYDNVLLKTSDPKLIAKGLIRELNNLNSWIKTNVKQNYIYEGRNICTEKRETYYNDDFVMLSDYGSAIVVVKSSLNLEDFKAMKESIKTICNNSNHSVTYHNNYTNSSTYSYNHGEWLNMYKSVNNTKVFIMDTRLYNEKEIGVLFCENENVTRFSEWVNNQCEKFFAKIVENGIMYIPASRHYEHRNTTVHVSCDSCGNGIEMCIGWKTDYDLCLKCASKYSGKRFGKGDVESLYNFMKEDHERKIKTFFGEEQLKVIACRKAIMTFLSIPLLGKRSSPISDKEQSNVSKIPKDVLLIIAKMVWNDRKADKWYNLTCK